MKRIGLKSISTSYLLGRTNLKRDLLYFDKLVFDEKELEMSGWLVEPLGNTLYGEAEFKTILQRQRNELDYLLDKGLIIQFDSNNLEKIAYNRKLKEFTDYFDKHREHGILFSHNDVLNLGSIITETNNILNGTTENPESIFRAYFLSALLNATSEVDTIPIVDQFIPEKESSAGIKYPVMEVVLRKFPVIDDTVSWEQLLDFRNDKDSKIKFLALRNWMIDVSKGSYSPSEISEKFDFLYQDYLNHIEKHKLKTAFGTVKYFAITGSEILEDLVRVKWSKAVKALFDIFERDTRLADIESNSPGKEVAYVHTLNEKFKRK